MENVCNIKKVKSKQRMKYRFELVIRILEEVREKLEIFMQRDMLVRRGILVGIKM